MENIPQLYFIQVDRYGEPISRTLLKTETINGKPSIVIYDNCNDKKYYLELKELFYDQS